MNERLAGRTSPRGQRGAALVEAALVLSIFLLLVIAVIEFSLTVLDISRAAEATRAVARTAIVADPACDIFGTGADCPDGQPLNCPAGAPVELDLAAVASGCSATSTDAPCRMLRAAQGILPSIEASNVHLRYACSGTGASVRPRAIATVTVRLEGVVHRLMTVDLFGLDGGITIPSFETTRTTEDLYSEGEYGYSG